MIFPCPVSLCDFPYHIGFFIFGQKNFADSHNLRKDLSPKNNSFLMKIYSFYVNHYTFNNVICQLPKKYNLFFCRSCLRTTDPFLLGVKKWSGGNKKMPRRGENIRKYGRWDGGYYTYDLQTGQSFYESTHFYLWSDSGSVMG